MARGIIAINIEKDDELIKARVTDGQQVIFLATHDGMAIRFNEQDLRPMGRPATGNKGIDLRKGDYVVGLAVTPSDEARHAQRRQLATQQGIDEAEVETILEDGAAGADTNGGSKLSKLDEKLGLTPCLILSVTENGYGKRTDVDAYRLQSRGGKGVINVKTTAKNGKVSSIQQVDETSEMMVISQFGKIIRIDTKSIRAAGRSTQGVKLLNLDADDKVAAAVIIPPEEAKTLPEEGTLLQ